MGTGTAGRDQHQFMALVSEGTLNRLDILRVATGQSRAEINRIALDGTDLGAQERQAYGKIAALKLVASKVGMPIESFVRALVMGRKAGVPKLEALEGMSTAELKAETAPR